MIKAVAFMQISECCRPLKMNHEFQTESCFQGWFLLHLNHELMVFLIIWLVVLNPNTKQKRGQELQNLQSDASCGHAAEEALCYLRERAPKLVKRLEAEDSESDGTASGDSMAGFILVD